MVTEEICWVVTGEECWGVTREDCLVMMGENDDCIKGRIVCLWITWF